MDDSDLLSVGEVGVEPVQARPTAQDALHDEAKELLWGARANLREMSERREPGHDVENPGLILLSHACR